MRRFELLIKRWSIVLVLCLSVLVVREPAQAEQQWPNGGFHHARFEPKSSIVVETHAEAPLNVAIRKAMNYWNKLAGWDLLVQDNTKPSEVYYHRFDPTCQTCALAFPSWNENYTSAQFFVWKRLAIGKDEARRNEGQHVLRHELGHTLGFSHEPYGIMKETNPKPDRAFDRTLLEQFGYAVPITRDDPTSGEASPGLLRDEGRGGWLRIRPHAPASPALGEAA